MRVYPVPHLQTGSDYAKRIAAKYMIEEDKATIVRKEVLRELLSEFGLTLEDYDPFASGREWSKVSGAIGQPAEKYLNFDSDEWDWLEPLLMELRERRMTDG